MILSHVKPDKPSFAGLPRTTQLQGLTQSSRREFAMSWPHHGVRNSQPFKQTAPPRRQHGACSRSGAMADVNARGTPVRASMNCARSLSPPRAPARVRVPIRIRRMGQSRPTQPAGSASATQSMASTGRNNADCASSAKQPALPPWARRTPSTAIHQHRRTEV